MASIWDWSSTAADNATADGDINWAEGQAPSTVNDSARFVMKRVKDFVVDIGGSITAGGTGNAITLTSSAGFTALANGLIIAFRAAATNTGAATLNVNSIGAKAIRKMTEDGEAALSGNEIQASGIYLAMYSTALASSAGGWLLINPTPADIATVLAAATAKTAPVDADTFPLIDSADSDALKELSWANAKSAMLAAPLVVQSTDAGADGAPDLDLYRNSASPAASDIIGRVLFNGEDSAGNKELYALARAVIGDPTSTSEDAALEFLTAVAGTLARRMVVGAGMYMDGATGGDKGAGTVNASLYDNTYRVAEMVLASGTASAESEISIDLSTYITAGFRRFELELDNVVIGTDNSSLDLVVSTNGGSSYVSSGYRYSRIEIYAGGTTTPAGSNSAAQVSLAVAVGASTDERGHMLIDLRSGTSWCALHWDGHLTNSGGNALTARGGGQVKQANANALKIAPSSGTISASWGLKGFRDA